jgi:hypothetical protein
MLGRPDAMQPKADRSPSSPLAGSDDEPDELDSVSLLAARLNF